MATSIGQVEASAREVSTIAENVLADAKHGQQTVAASQQGIFKIKTSSDITFNVIDSLSSQVANIGGILSVIEEVTEQTELLALNAAIIAAQAGEHGKSFAVVADEIKELAERTGASTREISQVISGVQQETERAVEAIKIAEEAIDDGILLTNSSSSALQQICNGVSNAANQIHQIAKVTVDQAEESLKIKGAMEEVSNRIQQIARATEEQANGGQFIILSAENMRTMTIQVLTSTRQQQIGSAHIAKTVEEISGLMELITIDCAKEYDASREISKAITDIRSTSEDNLTATNQLNEAVRSLLNQISGLKQQIAAFKV
jgi:methyl-accepting chemotaxis protein